MHIQHTARGGSAAGCRRTPHDLRQRSDKRALPHTFGRIQDSRSRHISRQQRLDKQSLNGCDQTARPAAILHQPKLQSRLLAKHEALCGDISKQAAHSKGVPVASPQAARACHTQAHAASVRRLRQAAALPLVAAATQIAQRPPKYARWQVGRRRQSPARSNRPQHASSQLS